MNTNTSLNKRQLPIVTVTLLEQQVKQPYVDLLVNKAKVEAELQKKTNLDEMQRHVATSALLEQQVKQPYVDLLVSATEEMMQLATL